MAESNVKHLEDLPAKDILKFISDPLSFSCTEKLDGSFIIIGRDNKGIYTRRQNKEKYYQVSDYNDSFASNYQKLVYYNNHNRVHVVLFKELNRTESSSEKVRGIKLLSTFQNSYTASVIKEHDYNTTISTIDSFKRTPEIRETAQQFFLSLLTLNHTIAGVELSSNQIIDWPLNRRHPGDFNKPWQEVKQDFKNYREKIRAIIKKEKMKLSEFTKADDPFSLYSPSVNEGYVFTNGDIEFKLVDQQCFTAFKNFVWQYRDMLRHARKQAGEIVTLEQVQDLRDCYLDIIDKYEVELKDSVELTSTCGRKFSETRSKTVKTRDISAFVTAFNELSRIENEIRRDNRNA
jgi:hypothetical protein